jgi:hypothetical protein
MVYEATYVVLALTAIGEAKSTVCYPLAVSLPAESVAVPSTSPEASQRSTVCVLWPSSL